MPLLVVLQAGSGMYWTCPQPGSSHLQAMLSSEFDRVQLAHIKIGLLSHGIMFNSSLKNLHYKQGIRVRSGTSGGIDLVLPGEIHVNCTISEPLSSQKPYHLECSADGGCYILLPDGCKIPVQLVPRPAFYDQRTQNNIPMVQVAQMCSADRVCVNLSRGCVFWSEKSERCQFCSIGDNRHQESGAGRFALVAEVVEAAAHDAILPARHVLIGGGTPNQQDRGVHLATRLAEKIRERVDLQIYAMLVPPKKLSDLKGLRDAGVTELGMNIELYSTEAMQRYIPGKFKRIGLNGYLKALEYGVRLFGPWNTRSILVAGLEPPKVTLARVERLASMGVLPILSPFKPLKGAMLMHSHTLDLTTAWQLYLDAEAICRHYGVSPGPSCIACQNNTLALPDGLGHRYY